MTNNKITSPFNSALETGVRALSILAASFPNGHDLSRLVQYDYLVVHSADANGPPSLHPPLPLRSGEMLVRRGLIESGIALMMSRGLIRKAPSATGFVYFAEEIAGSFLASMRSTYIAELIDRANWAAKTFDELDERELQRFTNSLFSRWTTQFVSNSFDPVEA